MTPKLPRRHGFFEHYEELVGTWTRRLRNRQQAEDLAHDTFGISAAEVLRASGEAAHFIGNHGKSTACFTCERLRWRRQAIRHGSRVWSRRDRGVYRVEVGVHHALTQTFTTAATGAVGLTD